MDELLITLVNVILKRMHLNWDGNCLRHKVKLSHGSIETLVDDRLETVVKILGMPKVPLMAFDDIYYNIINSKYFRKKDFKLSTVDDGLRAFIDRLKDDNPSNGCMAHVIEVDALNALKKHINMSPRINIGIKYAAKYSRRLPEMRNKFNGNLIKNWTGLENPLEIGVLIEEFKLYLSEHYGYSLHQYLMNTTPKDVRINFKMFYLIRQDTLAGGSQNKLPF